MKDRLTDQSLAKMRARIETAGDKPFIANVPSKALHAMIDELQTGRECNKFRNASNNMIHLAGHPVQVGPRQRQLCAWCGFVLLEYDLTLIAVPNKPDGSPGDPPRPFEQGVLVQVRSNFQMVVPHKDGDPLPSPNCVFEDEPVPEKQKPALRLVR